MYVFHSSGTEVFVVKAFVATQSQSARRLFLSFLSSFHGWASMSSWSLASKSSFDGFGMSDPKKLISS